MNIVYETEINRCLLCEEAPCSKACINNVKPADRIRSLYFDNEYSAFKDFNNECEKCEAYCEKECVLKKYDKF